MEVDWSALFVPDAPPLEIFVRGTIMYLALFVMLRFIIRREAGTMGIADVLVIVLIADAAQNAMAGDYTSIPDGLLLVATIIGWSYLLSLLAFHFPLWRRIVQPARVQLVNEGRLVWRNMEREKITEEELMGELHTHGVEELDEVRAAYIESDGMISVLTYRGRAEADGHKKKRAA